MKMFLCICISIVLFSCKKEDNGSYLGTYNSKSYQISKIKLFTKNNEITDTSIIHHFINEYVSSYFIFNYDSVVDVSNKLGIEFFTDNTANLFDLNSSKIRKVKFLNNLIYFESQDTSYNLVQQVFYNKVITYFPLYIDTFIRPSGSNIVTYGTKFKQCYYASGNNAEIQFPMMSYLYVRHGLQFSFTGEAESNLNNVFNENSLKYLLDNDTLAVQQFYVILRK
jgi:hypothetical protein